MKLKIPYYLLVTLLLMPLVRVSAQAPTEKAVEDKSKAKNEKKETPIALTVEALQEFETRKKNLDEREKSLNERASSLDVQEKVLREKLKKMEELNKKMSERLEKFKKEHEEKIVKLVAMVESMKPQSAAEYIENMDAELAVEILSRLDTKRAAKIINLADKKKSAKLSELYTGYRESIEEEKQASPPKAEQPQPKKEIENKKN